MIGIHDLALEAKDLLLPLAYFSDPQKRLYLPYLFTSFVLAVWVYRRSSTKIPLWNYVFAKKVWLSRSALTDYLVFLFNGLVKLFLIAPFLVWSLEIAFWIHEGLKYFIEARSVALGKAELIVCYTVTSFTLNDFSSYLVHRWMHQVSFLWSFHKTHHSATTLNPVTQYRVHPIELLINNLRAILVFGFVTGVFRFISEGTVSKLTFLGVGVFTFFFFIFGANLRHSHVKLSYPTFLEFLLISPYQHQIHHSREISKQTSNFGSKLAIWDWVFGSLALSKDVEKLRFGLGSEGEDFQTFWGSIFAPFREITKKLR
ncbi:MAG: sterol desaturase family protein [Myxococcota bacterium]|nr:sterol desaturase family protein [Myxococcota bacterium]